MNMGCNESNVVKLKAPLYYSYDQNNIILSESNLQFAKEVQKIKLHTHYI